MATLRKSCGYATGFVASEIILLFFALVSTVHPQADHLSAGDVGGVAIANSFGSQTQFTCYSDTVRRQTYIAGVAEYYYFSFYKEKHHYWDCVIYNRGWDKSGVFRFWADASHGGPALENCTFCNWSVDEFGVAMYVDNRWRYKYFWNTARQN